MRTLLLLAFSLFMGAQDNVFRSRVVEDHSGAALAAVSVRVSRVGVPGILKETETERSGDFTITGLPSGEYELAITKSNYMPTTVRIGVESGPPSIPLVRLIRYGVIAGRAPAGGVSVIEQVPEGYIARRFVATATNAGEYRAFGLPPGRYVVGTSTRGLALHPSNAQPREFSISGGEDYDRVDVSNAQIESFDVAGMVRSPEAASSYIVFVVSPDRPGLSLSTRVFTGPFRFPNILPGTYEVLVSAGLPPSPQLYGRLRFSVAGQAVENLEVPVSPGRSAEFSVQSGTCPQDATVTLSVLEAWTTPTGVGAKVSTALVEGKTARFERLFPGRYQVSVRDAAGGCYGVTDRILDLSGGSVAARPIVLKSAPSIRGRVAATNPPALVAVVLRDMEPGRESPVQVMLLRTGEPFSFPNLPPGHYCLAAHPNGESTDRWAPASGCASDILNLSPGDAKEIALP